MLSYLLLTVQYVVDHIIFFYKQKWPNEIQDLRV